MYPIMPRLLPSAMAGPFVTAASSIGPPRRFRSSPNLHDRLILFQVDFGSHFHVCLKCFLHLAAYKRDATRARAQEQEQALRKDYGDWGACTRCRAGPLCCADMLRSWSLTLD